MTTSWPLKVGIKTVSNLCNASRGHGEGRHKVRVYTTAVTKEPCCNHARSTSLPCSPVAAAGACPGFAEGEGQMYSLGIPKGGSQIRGDLSMLPPPRKIVSKRCKTVI